MSSAIKALYRLKFIVNRDRIKTRGAKILPPSVTQSLLGPYPIPTQTFKALDETILSPPHSDSENSK